MARAHTLACALCASVLGCGASVEPGEGADGSPPARVHSGYAARFEAPPIAPLAGVSPVTNVSCAHAQPLPASRDGAPVSTAFAVERGTACPGGIPEPGRVLYYTARVPGGASLRVLLAGRNVVARLRARCGVTACLGEGANNARGDTSEFVYSNIDRAPRDVVLEVGARGDEPEEFTLLARVEP